MADGAELSMVNLNDTKSYSKASGTPSSYSLFEQDGPASENITERVVIQCTCKEAVLEIIGRKGWKINPLRTKTNTYIKTPHINYDPTFIITGIPENVAAVKWELLHDADKNTQLCTSLPRPKIVSQCVAVPTSNHIAKIVWKKGRKIKGLMERAEIKIPARGDVPIFVITGSPEEVDAMNRELVIAAQDISQVSALPTNDSIQD